MEKKKVLFICTHNSARSQMAEGVLRALSDDRYEVYSAGTEPSMVQPQAIEVMGEIGIDISRHRSKNVEKFKDIEFEYVITVCDHARETCPFFLGGKKVMHKGFQDPSQCTGSEEEVLACFRNVRDKIRRWIMEVFDACPERKHI
jgi:arsenate reductase